MSGIMTKDRVQSKVIEASMFFSLMVIIVNKILHGIMSTNEFNVLER